MGIVPPPPAGFPPIPPWVAKTSSDMPSGGSSNSNYYTPSEQPSATGVIRSRTLFFLSIRDSIVPSGHGSGASAPLLGDNENHVYFDADKSTIPMPAELPPFWVDATEDADSLLSGMIPTLAELDRLHAQHLLPSFADKTPLKRQIEALTSGITSEFRQASQLVAKLAAQTTDAMRSQKLSKYEMTAARNAQTALATRVQQMSAMFRQKQSQYLRKLQGMEVKERGDTAMFDSVKSMQEDVALSEQLQGEQEMRLVDTDDSEAMFHERDREITQIARSIGELAQLFQDLSALVIEQGSMLDRIDYHIDSMAMNMQHSSSELNRASTYQVGAGRRSMILLLLLCIALLVAILIIRPFFR